MNRWGWASPNDTVQAYVWERSGVSQNWQALTARALPGSRSLMLDEPGLTQ